MCIADIKQLFSEVYAYRNQVSLHTNVLYKKDTDPVSFCTISGNTRHDPAAIWAHVTRINWKKKVLVLIQFISCLTALRPNIGQEKNYFLTTEVVHSTYGFENSVKYMYIYIHILMKIQSFCGVTRKICIFLILKWLA